MVKEDRVPRLQRLCPIGIPQHVIQRGNNRQVCFNTDEDMAAYANWLSECAAKYEVHIHAWVFMTNHYLCKALHKMCYVKPQIM